jgi:hypothetical protein
MLNNIFAFWDDLIDPLKCTFDGENKLIYINSNVTTLNVKEDIYSAFKRWMFRATNAKYEMGIRTIGGDPISPGVSAGEMYFLINGWQIYTDHNVKVNGVLYHDDQIDVYIGTGGVTSVVSNIVTGYVVATPQQIATAVWTEPTTTGSEGSFGYHLTNRVLSVIKFLGLK